MDTKLTCRGTLRTTRWQSCSDLFRIRVPYGLLSVKGFWSSVGVVRFRVWSLVVCQGSRGFYQASRELFVVLYGSQRVWGCEHASKLASRITHAPSTKTLNPTPTP